MDNWDVLRHLLGINDHTSEMILRCHGLMMVEFGEKDAAEKDLKAFEDTDLSA